MTRPQVHREVGPGLTLIDTGYTRPQHTASYLVESAGRAAFVETGAAANVPRLLSVLEARGLSREAVDYVVVTHVHLDHAGGAGALMAELPNARLVVHPRGARHMIEPSKLVAGVVAVYGQRYFDETYGTLTPVPAERVIEARDGLELSLGGRPLRCFDTPGHAYHHACLYDPTSRGVFTGDAFGLSYRELDTDQGPFVFPTTSPVHFDAEAMHASIERILSFSPERLYFTHFGVLDRPEILGRRLDGTIDAFVELARRYAHDENRHERLAAAVRDHLFAELRAHGCTLPEETLDAVLGMDIELDTQGLEVWVDKP